MANNNSSEPVDTHFLMSGMRSVAFQSSDRPHQMNRYMGGHRRSTLPYVSGYWYFMMLTPDVIFAESPNGIVGGLVQQISNSEQSIGTQDTSKSQSQRSSELWLHSTAESFTPPSTTLTKLDIPGMGGLGSSFISGREITRTFTVAFREYTNLPIMKILTQWTSIMDPYLGVSAVTSSNWAPNAYKGVAVAFLCKPTISSDDRKTISETDIEQLYYFDGVWPESAPHDSFNSDISTNDGVQLSVTFNFDGWAYTKDSINKQCASKAVTLFNQQMYSFGDAIKYINEVVVNSSQVNDTNKTTSGLW